MPLLDSRLDTAGVAFAANAQRMAERLAEVQRLEGLVIAESESKRERFEQRGQLLPRERIARLLDRGSGFLELSRLAGLGMHDDDGKKAVLGGGSIVGIGTVAGKRVLISASDSGVKGGTVPPMGLKKALRAQEIARENKLPLIALVESGGANLMYQAEIFVDGGRSFANQARLSAAGIPQIAVVHGSSTAGGAYLPGLSDYVVLVRGRSSIYLAGPPLVKAAIGEDAPGRIRHVDRWLATQSWDRTWDDMEELIDQAIEARAADAVAAKDKAIADDEERHAVEDEQADLLPRLPRIHRERLEERRPFQHCQ